MIEKCIDETSLPSLLSWSGMCVHSGIFIYDCEVIVFEYDIDREILRDEFHIFDLPLDTDLISSVDFFIFGEVSAITKYFPFINHLLEIAPRFFGKKSRQVSVDSSGFSWVREDTKG